MNDATIMYVLNRLKHLKKDSCCKMLGKLTSHLLAVVSNVLTFYFHNDEILLLQVLLINKIYHRYDSNKSS